MSGLEVGLTYNFSIDFKAVVNPVYSIQQNCIFYMFHDSLTQANLIVELNKVYARDDSSWATYGGTYTPDSGNLELGIYLSCTPYKSPILFNAYFDNARAVGTFWVTPTR